MNRHFFLETRDPITERTMARVREARRTLGRERHYDCESCGFERVSWVALRSCPSCGSGLAGATVTKTALA